jgi:hypothetical protein
MSPVAAQELRFNVLAKIVGKNMRTTGGMRWRTQRSKNMASNTIRFETDDVLSSLRDLSDCVVFRTQR